MNINQLSQILVQQTNACSVAMGEIIQSLWSGYGVIQRAELHFADDPSSTVLKYVIVKHVDLTNPRENRRGWGGAASHERKVRSYEVEKVFYESYSSRCDRNCRVPELVATAKLDDGWLIVLTDLDSEGFYLRKSDLDKRSLEACLSWLANFHATFLGSPATDLWPVGTYWHLQTRQEEFETMADGALKRSAARIDRRLNEAKYQTLIHGDAKVANSCFSANDPNQVAAVDFQYVGRGCGMKDVAYFISSCLSDEEASRQQAELLNYYFQALHEALVIRGFDDDFVALELEWRELYPFAWADFCRFLAGWAPDHWKLNAYSKRMTQSALEQ